MKSLVPILILSHAIFFGIGYGFRHDFPTKKDLETVKFNQQNDYEIGCMDFEIALNKLKLKGNYRMLIDCSKLYKSFVKELEDYKK